MTYQKFLEETRQFPEHKLSQEIYVLIPNLGYYKITSIQVKTGPLIISKDPLYLTAIKE